MFRSDPSLLYAAISSLSSAFESLREADSMSSSLTSFPPDYPFSGEVNAILSDVKSAKTDVSSLSRKISETRDRLCKLDNNFALAYYQCAVNSLNDFVGSLTVEQQMMKEMNQLKYETYLFNYLDDLNSKGLLPDDMVATYQYLKESKNYKQKIEELQNAAKELKALKENAPTLPNVGGARLSERQMEEYKKKSKEYSDYLKKKLALEKNIESLQKETGNYVNKWYEDFGEMFKKTGSAWSKGFNSVLSGEGFGDLKSAVKQTAATGAVIAKSTISGVTKLAEWVVDGAVVVDGSVASGATWLFNHDAGKKLMDRTLDFVRRDLVGESNKKFYENNTIGKLINENSNLKYDSAGAQAIQGAGEFVGKIALATAATVASGGTVAPIVIGAIYGAGKAGEKYAQSVDRNNGESYKYAKALLKSTAGAVAGAAEFYGYGQMGTSMLGVNISPQASTSFVKNFLTKDTFLDSVSVVTDHGINVAFDDETWQHALLYGGAEFALALGMNAIGARQVTKSARVVEAAEGTSRVIKQFDYFDISKVQPEVNNKISNMNDIYDSFNIMRKKFGETEAIARIREALTTGNHNFITREGNARQFLFDLDINDFNTFLSNIKLSEAYNGLLYRYGSEFEVDRRIQKIVNSKNWNYLDNSNGLVSDLYNYTGGNLDNLEHFLITKKLYKYPDLQLIGTEVAEVGDSFYDALETLDFFRVYDKKNDTHIYIQKNLNCSKDLNTYLVALDDIKKTSPRMASTLNELYITSIKNPADLHAAKMYGHDFAAAASANNGKIQIWLALNDREVLPVIYHESAHNFDKFIYDKAKRTYVRSVSDGLDWENAVRNDNNWASYYAFDSYNAYQNSKFAEDFAESVKNLKIMGAEKFIKEYPNRAKILYNVLPELFN